MYSDSELKFILQRAIDLDVRNVGVSGEEIVYVGVEVGVTEASIRQALEEYNATSPRIREGEPHRDMGVSAGRLMLLTTGLGITSGLLATGSVVTRLVLIPSITVVASALTIGGLMMISGGLALSDRTRSVGAFLKRNAAVWLGASFGWTLTAAVLEKFGVIRASAHAVEAGLATALTCAIVTSLAGGTYVAARAVRRHLSAHIDRTGSAPAFGRLSALKRRVVDRLTLWLDSLRIAMLGGDVLAREAHAKPQHLLVRRCNRRMQQSSRSLRRGAAGEPSSVSA